MNDTSSRFLKVLVAPIQHVNAKLVRWHPDLTLPNVLTGSRLFIAPLLVVFAWYGHPHLYVAAYGLAFVTDLADGTIARLLRLESEFGAKIDTWADLGIYFTVPVTAAWLWPQLFATELYYLLLIALSWTVPVLMALIKFGSLPSYHTWGTKLSVAGVGTSSLLLFVQGPVWPFHLAAVLATFAALEQTLITLTLKNRQTNIKSFWHAWRDCKARQHEHSQP